LKSKTSAEVNQYMLYAILQPFKIEKLHTDNGPAFRQLGYLEVMSALGITVINSASLSPRGRGTVEKKVYVVKKLLQKMLATRPTLSWKYLPFLVSKALNNSVSPKTGFRPAEMVLGPESAGANFLDLATLGPPHYSVKSNKLHIEQLRAEFEVMTEVATKKLTELRIVQNERVNKNRVERTFKINDIVFTLDRSVVEGNPRVLKTTLNPSPYVVIRPLFKSTLVMRIADRFTSLYNNEDLKVFKGNSPLFQELPREVLRALLYKFADFMESDFSQITANDPLRIPEAIPLFEPDEPQKRVTTDEETGVNLFGSPEIDSNSPVIDTEPDRIQKDSDPTLESPDKAALEEQFQELPDDDEDPGIDDDIEELLGQPEVSKIAEPEDTFSEESEEENEEQGMKLRSGTRKADTVNKTVRFQTK
jgi:hypothetical protein